MTSKPYSAYMGLAHLIGLCEAIMICEVFRTEEGESWDVWEFRYDEILRINDTYIRPLLKQLGLSLDWNDPDTTYEEDVRALMGALRGIQPEVIRAAKEIIENLENEASEG